MCETDSSMEYSEWSKTAISKFKCEAEREEEIIANVLQQTLSPTARCLPMFYNRHSLRQQDVCQCFTTDTLPNSNNSKMFANVLQQTLPNSKMFANVLQQTLFSTARLLHCCYGQHSSSYQRNCVKKKDSCNTPKRQSYKKCN